MGSQARYESQVRSTKKDIVEGTGKIIPKSMSQPLEKAYAHVHIKECPSKLGGKCQGKDLVVNHPPTLSDKA